MPPAHPQAPGAPSGRPEGPMTRCRTSDTFAVRSRPAFPWPWEYSCATASNKSVPPTTGKLRAFRPQQSEGFLTWPAVLRDRVRSAGVPRGCAAKSSRASVSECGLEPASPCLVGDFQSACRVAQVRTMLPRLSANGTRSSRSGTPREATRSDRFSLRREHAGSPMAQLDGN